MKKMSITELTKELLVAQYKDAAEEDLIGSGVRIIEDTIWGIKCRKFKPLGELFLPVNYTCGFFENIPEQEIQIETSFDYDFYEGTIARDDEGDFFAPSLSTRTPSNGNESIYISNEYGAASAKSLVIQHINAFFAMYRRRTKYNNEARNCLARSFIQYK